MAEYTPTTELVREWYVRFDHSGDKSRPEYEAEFNRWLADVKAEAWDEGYGSDEECGMPRVNPYRTTEREEQG